MRIQLVDDPHDPRLAPFRLHERQLTSRAQRRDPSLGGRFVAEGDLVVERAVAAGCRPVAVLCRDDHPPDLVAALPEQVPVYAASAALRRVVTGLGVPLDVIAVFERPEPVSVDELAVRAKRILVIEAVDNPSNVGALVRSAAGLGWDALVLDDTSADPLSRRALRTAMGTVFALRFARCPDLPRLLIDLGATGMLTLAMTPAADALPLRQLSARPERVALAVGAERSGLSTAVQRACELRVSIPMAAGVDSLNVAAAAAIACHYLGPERVDLTSR